MALASRALVDLLALRRSQDLNPNSLPKFFAFLFKRYDLAFVDLSSGDFPTNLFEHECVMLYIDPASVLITIKLKSAIAFGKVAGVMLSNEDSAFLNSKLLPFRRALSAERKRQSYSSVSFRKYSEVEVSYKRVELQGDLQQGIKLMSALTAVAKLPRVVRINLTAVKHKLLKPISHESCAEMVEVYTDFVEELTGLTRDEISEELMRMQGIVTRSTNSLRNTAASLQVLLEGEGGRSKQTYGDDSPEKSRFGLYPQSYLCRITADEINESRSNSGVLSQNQEQAFLSRDDTEEEPGDARPIVFTRETPQDLCSTPSDSGDSFQEIVYNPFKTERRLETVDELAEDRLDCFSFVGEDMSEGFACRPKCRASDLAEVAPVLSFRMSEILEDDDEFKSARRITEEVELMECCSVDAQCSKVCLVF
jgi:hypothetical protein